mgnify:CR=1 FL=1
MNMFDWAKREVQMACDKLDKGSEDYEYYKNCYESALKAYECLCDDGHSGMSWSITRCILDSLTKAIPLTPITDEDFIVNEDTILMSDEYLKENNMKSEVQCPRMSSLFRTEYLDGRIKYSDVNRVACHYINDPKFCFHSGTADKLVDELYPITMPYSPYNTHYEVYCEEYLVDHNIGDWDTEAWYYLITPNGEKVELNKFYKYTEDAYGNNIQTEITVEEFDERREIARKKELNEEK